MNGEVCCILGVCCPPENRAAALSKELASDPASPLSGDTERADRVAVFLLKHFDFAPAGTLDGFVKAIAGHAKKVKP